MSPVIRLWFFRYELSLDREHEARFPESVTEMLSFGYEPDKVIFQTSPYDVA